MLLVVADTGPIRYLVEIGYIDLLPQLFDKIFIPSVVCDELRHAGAPGPVRTWATRSRRG
jgi:predicted nucleic acid-binding protein